MGRRDVHLLDGVAEDARKLVRRRKQPNWIDPMLATLTEEYFSDPAWVFEPKLDGVRCLAFKSGKRVRLMSRNQLSLNDRYPAVVDAVSRLELAEGILDGEVAVVSAGVSRFQSLQRHLLEGAGSLAYYVFDAPHLAGHDLTALPLLDRKQILANAVTPGAVIELVGYREGSGEAYLQEACEQGWEGLIAKRASAPYVQGRAKEWLKFKCSKEQEFVVGGFTDPQGAREGFGALLVGYHSDEGFLYAGKVGTGYNHALLRSLTARLTALEQPESPFAGKPPARKRVHWVRPELVVQVGFSEWTRDGRLRHPRFLGVRDDKDAGDVVREAG
ncbi:MAG: non-homologous end-joining DNA ligase [Actinomycetota bacterium]|nr:non-homologous end-joining DNA ligase [Actinomycetota bacterium]